MLSECIDSPTSVNLLGESERYKKEGDIINRIDDIISVTHDLALFYAYNTNLAPPEQEEPELSGRNESNSTSKQNVAKKQEKMKNRAYYNSGSSAFSFHLSFQYTNEVISKQFLLMV